MHPILFQVGGFIVGTHNFFIALGVAAAGVVFFYECRRRGELSEQMLWIVAGALIGGALGAKLSAVIGSIGTPAQARFGAVLMHGGRSIVGGIAGAYIAVLLTKRVVAYPKHTGDLFAPGLALGMAVGRFGCFFSELPGSPTSLPWGIRLTPIQVALLPDCPEYCRTATLHPSFAYEILFDALMFGLIWFRWRARPELRDQLLKLFLLCYAVFRFLVEFVRGHEPIWHSLTGAQVFLLPVIVLLGIYFIRRRGSSFALVGVGLTEEP